MSFYDLRDALAEPGCAVCHLTRRASEEFVDSLLWESVNDPDARDRIREARGFCPSHAWALAGESASLGSVIISHDLLKNVLRILEAAKFQERRWLSLRSLRGNRESLSAKEAAAATTRLVTELTPQAQCPVCAHVQEMEDIYLSNLVEHFLGPDGLMAAYEASEGLCLPHFRGAMSRADNKALFEVLIEAQRRIWEKLADQLEEIIRKSDYRFRDEAIGQERGAGLRVIAALVGARPRK
jgi:hypothetical protein